MDKRRLSHTINYFISNRVPDSDRPDRVTKLYGMDTVNARLRNIDNACFQGKDKQQTAHCTLYF